MLTYKKSSLSSKTIIGAVAVIVTASLSKLGYSVGNAIGDASGIVDLVVIILEALFTIWGRVTATKRIGK